MTPDPARPVEPVGGRGIEAAAKAAYALGDHLHQWELASEDTRLEYEMAVALAATPAPQGPAVEGIEAAAICRVVIEELAYTYEAGYTGAQMQEAVRQTLLTAVQPLLAALAAEKAAHERTNAKLAVALDEITLVNELAAATLATTPAEHVEPT